MSWRRQYAARSRRPRSRLRLRAGRCRPRARSRSTGTDSAQPSPAGSSPEAGCAPRRRLSSSSRCGVHVTAAQQLDTVDAARPGHLGTQHQDVVPLAVASAAAERDVHRQRPALSQFGVFGRERQDNRNSASPILFRQRSSAAARGQAPAGEESFCPESLS